MTTITKYETGATSHAVNDLILFADNTRELAEFRDGIYKQTILFKETIYVLDHVTSWQRQFIRLYKWVVADLGKGVSNKTAAKVFKIALLVGLLL